MNLPQQDFEIPVQLEGFQGEKPFGTFRYSAPTVSLRAGNASGFSVSILEDKCKQYSPSQISVVHLAALEKYV